MNKYVIRVDRKFIMVESNKSISLVVDSQHCTILDLLDVSKLFSQVVKSGKYGDQTIEVVLYDNWLNPL